MKILVDRSVPFLENVFEPYAEVTYVYGRDISREMIVDCDAMIINNQVRCGMDLLEGTSVKMIASASIGVDHVDTECCKALGIHVSKAYGGDANSVMNYVFSALYGVAARKSINLSGKTFGIVGVGSTGAKVAQMARHLGFSLLLCDSNPSPVFGAEMYCDLDRLLAESDIVTLHVPLNDDTRIMADEAFFGKIKEGAIFINASRGEVVDENVLMKHIPKLGAVVIDTWDHEPDINQDLLEMVDVATPHIAGYSYQAKQSVTAMSVRAVARFFGISDLYEFYPPTTVAELAAVKLDMRGKLQGQIASEFQYNYPIFTDDFMFRMDPDDFEGLQKRYNYRREFYIDY